MLRVCVFVCVVVFSFTSAGFSQDYLEFEFDPAKNSTSDPVAVWREKLSELQDAQKEILESESAMKIADKKDKKTAAESLKEVKMALDNAKAEAKKAFEKLPMQYKVAQKVSTIAQKRWFLHSNSAYDMQRPFWEIPLKNPEFTTGNFFGFRSINPGSRTVIRGGFGNAPSFPNGVVLYNAVLVATTSDSLSGIGIEADTEPLCFFLQLDERQVIEEVKEEGEYIGNGKFKNVFSTKVNFVDDVVQLNGRLEKSYQFIPPGKGIFLIFPNQVAR